MPPRRKLVKLVMATALKVRKAANMTAAVLPRNVEVVVKRGDERGEDNDKACYGTVD